MSAKFRYVFRADIAGGLFLLLVSYYINSNLLFHQHTIDGQSVFHSHFSTKEHRSDSGSDGGHTFEAAILIASLNNIAIEEQSFESHIADCEWFTECDSAIANTLDAKCSTITTRSLRAPPTISL